MFYKGRAYIINFCKVSASIMWIKGQRVSQNLKQKNGTNKITNLIPIAANISSKISTYVETYPIFDFAVMLKQKLSPQFDSFLKEM